MIDAKRMHLTTYHGILREVRTHEVPEDDVPHEYLDKD